MSAPPKLEKFPTGDISVLVVEDEESTRALLVRLLSAMGAAKVLEAQDGSEGLRLACLEKPTLAICDIEMAPVDGLSFLGGVRASLDKAVVSLPVVMFTASKESEAMEKARALGVQGYLLKPFTPQRFSSVICDIVVRYHRTDWSAMGTPPKES